MRMQATCSPSRREGQKREAGRAGRHWGCVCVCVCVCARASPRARGCGGCLHLESQPITALNQEGQALPGLVEVQPVRCLCLVGRAASLVRSRRGWVLGEHSPWKPGWGGGGRHPPTSSPPRCGASVWGGAAVAGPPTWAAGGSPLPVETRAERGAHVGGGTVAPPSLVWAAGPLNASP